MAGAPCSGLLFPRPLSCFDANPASESSVSCKRDVAFPMSRGTTIGSSVHIGLSGHHYSLPKPLASFGASVACKIDLEYEFLYDAPYLIHPQGRWVRFVSSGCRDSAFCLQKGSFSGPLAPSRKIMLSLFCDVVLLLLLSPLGTKTRSILFSPGASGGCSALAPMCCSTSEFSFVSGLGVHQCSHKSDHVLLQSAFLGASNISDSLENAWEETHPTPHLSSPKE